MPKYQQKYLKPTVFNPKGHPWTGIVWPVKGSTGKDLSLIHISEPTRPY